MNFALMFALALGIDYALFVVARFRGAHFGQKLNSVDAVATTMDTAGKAVLFSGLTVLVSLSAVMLVPSPAFRSTALGIIVAVLFVLAAAALAARGACEARPSGRPPLASLAPQRRPNSPRFARWGERLWRRPCLSAALAVGAPSPCPTRALAARRCPRSRLCRPAITRGRAMSRSSGLRTGAPGALQIVGPAAAAHEAIAAVRQDPGVVRSLPPIPVMAA